MLLTQFRRMVIVELTIRIFTKLLKDKFMIRNPKKICTLSDFETLDAPERLEICNPSWVAPMPVEQHVLRMLVKPKYGKFSIPEELNGLRDWIFFLYGYDSEMSQIENSWCYVTVRHGIPWSERDDEWHFDGVSFRTELIPDRNYIWVNRAPTQFKTGSLTIPSDFDPAKYNFHTFAAKQLEHNVIQEIEAQSWYYLSQFCLHRRQPDMDKTTSRTFIRISFTDIEIRDEMNTQNPLLPTDAYGRNPVKSFRNQLIDYPN